MDLNSKESFQNIFTHKPWEGQEIFCDATLKTDDGCEFRVHKTVLSQKSKYFKSLFDHASEYEKINGIYMKCIDGITLNNILLYVYCGVVDFNKNNICKIVIAADYFLMDDLVNKGWSFATKHLPETCLEALAIAGNIQRLSTTTDYYCCHRHFIVHFQEIFSKNNVGILPLATFKAILNHTSLNVTSEETVWKAVVSWVEVDKSERLKNIKELLKFIRLREEVDDLLASNILRSDLVKNNPYLPYQNLTKQKNFFFSNFYSFTLGHDILLSHPRRPNRLHYIIDDSTTTAYGKRCLCLTYDDECDFVRKICLLHANKIVRSGHHLYLFNTWRKTDKAFSYNIVNESGSILQLPTHRENFSVVAIGENVYVIGQETDELICRTIDCYHTSLESWVTITMPEYIVVEDVAALKDCIYIFGWEDISKSSNICHIYKPENNSWSVTYPISLFKGNFLPVSHNGKIYVFGSSRPQNVEEYNPENRRWTKLPPLPLEFNCFTIKAISLGDTLVITDHHYCTRWDTYSNRWISIQVTEALRNMHRFQFCTVVDKQLIDYLTRRNRRSGIQWKRLLQN